MNWTDHFSMAFSVVCPLCLLMGLGYGLRRARLLTPALLDELNAVSFKIFFPAVVFVNIYRSDVSQLFNGRLIAFAVGSVVLIFVVLMILVPRFEKDNRKRGVLIQGIFRSNNLLFGFPMIITLFGEEHTGVVSIVLAIVIPIFNILAVVALEVFKGSGVSVRRVVRGVATNPLILATAAALILSLSGLRLPDLIAGTVVDISRITTPLALIVLGGSFTFGGLSVNWKQLTAAVMGRLIVIPGLFLSLAVAVGFRGVELAALVALFTPPAAVSSYAMAVQMEGDGQLAGQIVVVTSVCSILSVFAAVALIAPYLFV